MSNPKRPKDVNQLAKMIVDMTTDAPRETLSFPPSPPKNEAAVSLGRLGGLKGGKARAESLTPEQRSEIAKKAAAKRWGKSDGQAED
jgi:hypothetical protein